MTRSLAAARLYLVNKWTLLWLPLILISAMVALTIGLELIVLAAGGNSHTVGFNGAFQAVFWAVLGVAISASTQVFPFAFAMSLTRREFVLGTLVVAVCVAVGYGLIYALLAWLETVTDGYGIGAHSFDVMGFVGGSVGETFVFYAGLLLLFFLAGFAGSMLWKRFGGKGLVATGLLGVVIVSGLAAWAGLANAWPGVFQWVVTQTPVSVGLYAVAACVVLAGGSYLMIRRAVP